MRVLVVPPIGVTFPEDSPWGFLLLGLRHAGHEVAWLGTTSQGCEALVALNHQDQVKRIQAEWGITPARSALVVLEPRVTAPLMYRHSVLSRYGHRYAASPMWADKVHGEEFLWPQVLSPRSPAPGSTAFAATVINGDKRSAVPGSLYGLRRSVIRSCEEQSIPIAVFGPGWGNSFAHRAKQAAGSIVKATKAGVLPAVGESLRDLRMQPVHWMGAVDNKRQAFAVARHSIVIENSGDYVSEKLIDAVCAGVVPLYVGPQIRQFGLPADIAISCEANASHIVETLRRLTEDRRWEVAEAGREWIGSAESRRHEIRVVLEDLGLRIGEQLGSRH